MKTVLVTGGAGYIGSHCCKALAAAGYTPVVYDNLVTGHRRAVRWGPFEYGDIGDRARLDEVVARHAPEAVLHFAAFAYVGESVADPMKYYRNNVTGSLTLLQAVRDHGMPRMIFSSSCTVYGDDTCIPIGEDVPLGPVNPYGMTKMIIERALAELHRAGGPAWIALRYFNAAGADPGGEVGEEHDPETHIIPLALAAASGHRDRFVIFGSDYQTRDGTCVRDYIHVSDLARAHVLALQALERGHAPAAYNLGTGVGHSVREIVSAVEAVTGCTVPTELGSRRLGDPPRLVANADRARTGLGWSPEFAELPRIVETAWQWHVSRH